MAQRPVQGSGLVSSAAVTQTRVHCAGVTSPAQFFSKECLEKVMLEHFFSPGYSLLLLTNNVHCSKMSLIAVSKQHRLVLETKPDH
jgi:hypothetical protein